MTYQDWRLLVGQNQEREWGDREYRFTIGKEHRDADPVLQELQSNTPLRHLIENAEKDNIIRVITYLSYYLINPTFNHDESEDIGTDFFWFPLDRLTEERYEELVGEVENDDEDAENDDDKEDEDEGDDDAALPDFPIMSTVGEPVIEAATSDDYVKSVSRKSERDRQEILQEEIRRRKEELIEEIEEWLEEGMEREQFGADFSAWAEDMGTFPARFLLGGIYHEQDRIEKIHEIFSSMDPVEQPDQLSPEVLLQKLTNLTEEHPVLVNPAIEAYCLDEHNRDCKFHITKHRGYELEDSVEKCEHCGSDLYRVFRSGIDDTVRDAWMMGLLPELVTARIFEECTWVKDVIPHRLVQMKDEDGKFTSSVEVDVSVQTENDEVIFFEVTSQRGALNRVNDKKNKFKENNIEYDGIVQLSLTDTDQFIDFGDETIAGGAWMISDLESDEFYEDLAENLNLEK